MTKSELQALKEEGTVGLDLSPGNELCFKAHEYIQSLLAYIKELEQ